MPDTTLDPKAIAQAVAFETAEDESEVGDFVTSVELGDGVTDFRFESKVRGYEGWQWSVTLYHDEDAEQWTVNESTLIPTDDALLPPKWIPWKDRLEPTDLSVTDSIGTDPEDPRIESGVSVADMRKVVDAAEAQANEQHDAEAESAESEAAGTGPSEQVTDGVAEETSATSDETGESAVSESSAVELATAESANDASDQTAQSAPEDIAEAVTEFELSRRHVLTPLGRAQTAKRWYDGPHGPKSLSTKTAGGNVCANCGFFVPLKGELNLLFGVCANKWSPDDGRVVSLDHGCGEHSEIDPPEPSHLWVQSKPAFDDLHIDVVAQKPRDEHGEVELLERLGEGNHLASMDDDDDQDEATEADIEAQTVPDDEASDDDIAAETNPDDSPEIEATVELGDVADDDAVDDVTDDAVDDSDSDDTIAIAIDSVAESSDNADDAEDSDQKAAGQEASESEETVTGRIAEEVVVEENAADDPDVDVDDDAASDVSDEEEAES